MTAAADPRTAALEHHAARLRDSLGLFGGDRWASVGAGVALSIAPGTPRAIANVVVYERPARLIGALASIAQAYREAHVGEWAVWVPEWDGVARAGLAARRYVRRELVRAMVLDLSEREPRERGGGWRRGSADELAALNDVTYALASGGLLGTVTVPDRGRIYVAVEEGSAVSALCAIDSADGLECGINMVATPPRSRRRGHARRLLDVALDEASQRGCRSARLQASPVGVPLYERAGFRSEFNYELYHPKEMQ